MSIEEEIDELLRRRLGETPLGQVFSDKIKTRREITPEEVAEHVAPDEALATMFALMDTVFRAHREALMLLAAELDQLRSAIADLPGPD